MIKELIVHTDSVEQMIDALDKIKEMLEEGFTSGVHVPCTWSLNDIDENELDKSEEEE